ncbi:cilia-and flagella-associated protein 91 [Caerostris extrusa]|uniref:Cilia- and flagella-associated protein 91 n=1 Tax=Caerostris extrusa TaxID=172846 RepID=A0AAV4N0C9_CAEEX|nr:cilia-and flagella-associated protein 91 [Caerostris extrusa]
MKRSCSVTGADFCKFYHRPLDSTLKSGDIIEDDENALILSLPIVLQEDKFISRATQTDYRESETQTDPWDPPFHVTKIKGEPEILSLKKFSYGNGLPAGHVEVKYISESRKNRIARNQIKSSVDAESFIRKKQLIFDQVKNDWTYRTTLLDEKRLQKLRDMQSTLINEIKKHSEKRERFLSNMWSNKVAQMCKHNSKMEQDLQKELRYLDSAISDKEYVDTTKADSLLQEEISFKTPKFQTLFTKGTEYMLSNYYLTDPAGMFIFCEKKWLETKTENLNTEIPLSRVFKRSRRERLAEKAYLDILEKRRSKLPPKIYHEDYVKEEPPMPSVKAEDVIEFFDFEEKKVDLVTIWQKALRGLSRQKQMLELIERHKEGLTAVLSQLYPEFSDS